MALKVQPTLDVFAFSVGGLRNFELSHFSVPTLRVKTRMI